MIKALTVKWLERDETIINYSDDFEAQDWVLKADILKDTIAMLEKRYNYVLKFEAALWQDKGKNHATK